MKKKRKRKSFIRCKSKEPVTGLRCVRGRAECLKGGSHQAAVKDKAVFWLDRDETFDKLGR